MYNFRIYTSVFLFSILVIGCDQAPGKGGGGSPQDTDPDPDGDADGYDLSEDCNDNDPNVRPDGIETCSDGVDQDCNGRDLTCQSPHLKILSGGATGAYTQVVSGGVAFTVDVADVAFFDLSRHSGEVDVRDADLLGTDPSGLAYVVNQTDEYTCYGGDGAADASGRQCCFTEEQMADAWSSGSIDCDDAAFRIYGEPGFYAGQSLLFHDVNGDAIDDLVLTSSGYGVSAIYGDNQGWIGDYFIPSDEDVFMEVCEEVDDASRCGRHLTVAGNVLATYGYEMVDRSLIAFANVPYLTNTLGGVQYVFANYGPRFFQAPTTDAVVDYHLSSEGLIQVRDPGGRVLSTPNVLVEGYSEYVDLDGLRLAGENYFLSPKIMVDEVSLRGGADAESISAVAAIYGPGNTLFGSSSAVFEDANGDTLLAVGMYSAYTGVPDPENGSPSDTVPPTIGSFNNPLRDAVLGSGFESRGLGGVLIFNVSQHGIPEDWKDATHLLLPPNNPDYWACGHRVSGGVVEDTDGVNTVVTVGCNKDDLGVGALAYRLEGLPRLPRPMPNVEGAVQEIEPGEYIVDRDTVSTFLLNRSLTRRLAFFNGAYRTEVEGTKVQYGWQITRMRPEMALLGLQVNDVVTRVNGKPVMRISPMTMVTKLPVADRITLTLERNGRTINQSYSLR